MLLLSACGGGSGSTGNGGNNENNNNTAVKVAISPMTATVRIGGSASFIVTAQNTDYTIDVSTDAGCSKNSNTITCVPTVSGNFTLTVAATADTSKKVSATLTVNPDTNAPTVPANLTATVASATQINLSWSPATDDMGVAGYKVYRDGTHSVEMNNVLAFSDMGLSGATKYCYQVTAHDAAGNESDLSETVCATTQSDWDDVKPTVPGGLTATVDSTQINLVWAMATDNTGVVGYRVYREGVASPVWSGEALSFTDTGLMGSTRYCYQVSAYDAAGNESGKSGSVCATTNPVADTIKPTIPSNLTTTVVSATQIDLTWTASTDNIGVVGYKLVKADPFNQYILDVPSTSVSYSDTGLNSSTQYCYQMLALDAAGNTSGWGELVCATTKPVTDTTNPTIPENLTATASSATQINLTWTAATDNIKVAGYRVYRDGAVSPIWSGSAVSFSNAGLTNSTKYCYQVSAFDASGNESGKSGSVCATTKAIPDTVKPTVPVSLTATTVSATQINLTWMAATDNTGVAGYYIYRNDVFLTSVTDISFSNTGLTGSTQYCYRVTAYDVAGNESDKSESVCVTTPQESVRPAPPQNVTATAVSTTQIKLTWTVVESSFSVAGYRVYRDGATSPVWSGTTAEFLDTGLTNLTNYCYQVLAYTSNNSSVKSDQICATTMPSMVIPKLEVVSVQGGTFTMGCTSEQEQEYHVLHREDICNQAMPWHQVTLNDFYIGKYEVTQAQWKTVMGDIPPLNQVAVGDNKPMLAEWDNIQNFIDKLNAMEAAAGNSRIWRLPTEAEWEYAARGGVKSRGLKYSGSDYIDSVSWWNQNSHTDPLQPGSPILQPAGTKQANELGIYDMSGNSGEVVADWYGPYSATSQVNPTGPTSGERHVERGGSYADDVTYSSLVSYRVRIALPQSMRGFRLATSSK
jgi:formylglycine-generating enzyme required for sulfatase activity